MRLLDKLILCERRRELVAYHKLARGLTLKECAETLGISNKNAEYYWQTVKDRMHQATQNLNQNIL